MDFYGRNYEKVCRLIHNSLTYESANQFIIGHSVKPILFKKYRLKHEDDLMDEEDTIYDPNEHYIQMTHYMPESSNLEIFILRDTNPTVMLRNMLDTYENLLDRLNELSSINICVLSVIDKVYVNTVYDTHNLRVFFKPEKESIVVNHFDSADLSLFLTNLFSDTQFMFLFPLEVFVLSFVIDSRGKSQTYNSISVHLRDYISDLYMQSIAPFIPDTLHLEFNEYTKKELQKYVNKPKQYIINYALSHLSTWSVYSSSIYYLKILSNTHSSFFERERKRATQFRFLLLKNIHPSPDKRDKTVDDAINSYIETL
jgi:hypothetical protein